MAINLFGKRNVVTRQTMSLRAPEDITADQESLLKAIKANNRRTTAALIEQLGSDNLTEEIVKAGFASSQDSVVDAVARGYNNARSSYDMPAIDGIDQTAVIKRAVGRGDADLVNNIASSTTIEQFSDLTKDIPDPATTPQMENILAAKRSGQTDLVEAVKNGDSLNVTEILSETESRDADTRDIPSKKRFAGMIPYGSTTKQELTKPNLNALVPGSDPRQTVYEIALQNPDITRDLVTSSLARGDNPPKMRVAGRFFGSTETTVLSASLMLQEVNVQNQEQPDYTVAKAVLDGGGKMERGEFVQVRNQVFTDADRANALGVDESVVSGRNGVQKIAQQNRVDMRVAIANGYSGVAEHISNSMKGDGMSSPLPSSIDPSRKNALQAMMEMVPEADGPGSERIRAGQQKIMGSFLEKHSGLAAATDANGKNAAFYALENTTSLNAFKMLGEGLGGENHVIDLAKKVDSRGISGIEAMVTRNPDGVDLVKSLKEDREVGQDQLMADVKIPGSGKTAKLDVVSMALLKGSKELATSLINEAGMDVNGVEGEISPMQAVIQFSGIKSVGDRADMVAMLVDNGATLDGQPNLMQQAVDAKSVGTIKATMQGLDQANKADVIQDLLQAKDAKGVSALETLVLEDRVVDLDAILQSGSLDKGDLTVETEVGGQTKPVSLATYAALNGRSDILATLKNNGVDVAKADPGMDSPLLIALTKANNAGFGKGEEDMKAALVLLSDPNVDMGVDGVDGKSAIDLVEEISGKTRFTNRDLARDIGAVGKARYGIQEEAAGVNEFKGKAAANNQIINETTENRSSARVNKALRGDLKGNIDYETIAKVRATNPQAEIPGELLTDAIAKKDFKLVKALVGQDPSVLSAENKESLQKILIDAAGETSPVRVPGVSAGQYQANKTIQTIIDIDKGLLQGADDTPLTTPGGRPLLVSAAAKRNNDLVTMLLDNGVSASTEYQFGTADRKTDSLVLADTRHFDNLSKENQDRITRGGENVDHQKNSQAISDVRIAYKKYQAATKVDDKDVAVAVIAALVADNPGLEVMDRRAMMGDQPLYQDALNKNDLPLAQALLGGMENGECQAAMLKHALKTNDYGLIKEVNQTPPQGDITSLLAVQDEVKNKLVNDCVKFAGSKSMGIVQVSAMDGFQDAKNTLLTFDMSIDETGKAVPQRFEDFLLGDAKGDMLAAALKSGNYDNISKEVLGLGSQAEAAATVKAVGNPEEVLHIIIKDDMIDLAKDVLNGMPEQMTEEQGVILQNAQDQLLDKYVKLKGDKSQAGQEALAKVESAIAASVGQETIAPEYVSDLLADKENRNPKPSTMLERMSQRVSSMFTKTPAPEEITSLNDLDQEAIAAMETAPEGKPGVEALVDQYMEKFEEFAKDDKLFTPEQKAELQKLHGDIVKSAPQYGSDMDTFTNAMGGSSFRIADFELAHGDKALSEQMTRSANKLPEHLHPRRVLDTPPNKVGDTEVPPPPPPNKVGDTEVPPPPPPNKVGDTEVPPPPPLPSDLENAKTEALKVACSNSSFVEKPTSSVLAQNVGTGQEILDAKKENSVA